MANPVGQVVGQIKDWQLHFLERGDNCASHCVDWISENTHSFTDTAGLMHACKKIISAVEAYLMPAAVATALLQETIALGCELGKKMYL